MDRVKLILSDLSDAFFTISILEREPLAIAGALAALIAILIALRASAKADSFSGSSTERVSGRLDEFDVRLKGLEGRLERENARLRHEVLELVQSKKGAEQRDEVGFAPDEDDTTRIDSTKDQIEKKKLESVHSGPSHSIADSLKKTREAFFSKISDLFRRKDTSDESLYDAIEELLIGSDLGLAATNKLIAKVRKQAEGISINNQSQINDLIKEALREILGAEGSPEVKISPGQEKPAVIVVVGVNGVGKTTTIAKLAQHLTNQGLRVLLAGADTFRAAASDQLEVWAKRIGVDLVSGGTGVKPATVAYQALHRGQQENYDVVIIDTAGRLHTRVNLMNELGGVLNIVSREQPGAPDEIFLVLDATTGQNALQQAKVFQEHAKLTGVIVTKLDGTAKGGIVVAIKDELGIPIRYVGVGEGINDLKPFAAGEFINGLFE